jgi:hypothetical protein
MNPVPRKVALVLSDSNRERARPKAGVDPQEAYRQRTIRLLPSRRLRPMRESLQQLDQGYGVPSRQIDSDPSVLNEQPANLVPRRELQPIRGCVVLTIARWGDLTIRRSTMQRRCSSTTSYCRSRFDSSALYFDNSRIRASRIHDRHGLSAPSALNSLELEFVNF